MPWRGLRPLILMANSRIRPLASRKSHSQRLGTRGGTTDIPSSAQGLQRCLQQQRATTLKLTSTTKTTATCVPHSTILGAAICRAAVVAVAAAVVVVVVVAVAAVVAAVCNDMSCNIKINQGHQNATKTYRSCREYKLLLTSDRSPQHILFSGKRGSNLR